MAYLAPRATNPIIVAAGAELQYSGNGGSKFNDPIQGAGDFNLFAGTVQLTGIHNTYTGGTVIQIGATLDVSVVTGSANLPTGGNGQQCRRHSGCSTRRASDAFSGVMSDGIQAGGPTDPNDVACTVTGLPAAVPSPCPAR